MIDRRPELTAPAPVTRSVTDLLQDTAAHTENVVRGEIRLAVVRVQDQLTSRARQAVFMLLGGVMGLTAFVVLLVAGIMRLSQEMEPWLATGIAGLFVATIATLLVLVPSRTNGESS